MGADHNIKRSLFQLLQNLLLCFCAFESVDVVDTAGKILQPVGEGFEMLQSQDGGGNQDSYLFALSYHFKSCPDGDFGLPEAYIPANQTIHREISLHIPLDIQGRFDLIRCILIDKRCFKLCLQIGVRHTGKPQGGLSFSIEFDQVFSNVFDPLLGAGFELFPHL